MNKDFNLLLQQTTKISMNQNATILIEDSVDVDMTFVFKLAVDNENAHSYTRYNVIDNANGEIIIYNIGAARTVSLKEPMPVGTYKKEFRLYVNYVLYVATNKADASTIDISFLTSKE